MSELMDKPPTDGNYTASGVRFDLTETTYVRDCIKEIKTKEDSPERNEILQNLGILLYNKFVGKPQDITNLEAKQATPTQEQGDNNGNI